MLKPFLIRDLHEDSPSPDIIKDTASNLYNATDVGSSLELAQRLDEPPPQNPDADFPSTIHLFDIRRRRSITDLWKRYEYDQRRHVPESPDIDVTTADLGDHPATSQAEQPDTSRDQMSHVDDDKANQPENESSESFLSAFEMEMARLMNETQPPENNAFESTSSPSTVQTESTPNVPRETAEAFASALRGLVEVAEIIKSGVLSRLPELERHLDNARRNIPNDLTDSMRNTLLAFEEQVKTMLATLNNIPETIRRDNLPGNANIFSELPTPYSAMNGLREMSVQLGGMGQTLMDTLESGIRGAFPGQADSIFSSFPSFSESTTPAADPHSTEPESASRQQDNASPGQAQSDNPAASPFQQSATAPNLASNSQPPASLYPFWGPTRLPYMPPFDWPASSSGFGPSPSTVSPGSGTAAESHQTHTDLPEPPSLESHPSRSLFIGNIGFNVTEAMVKDVFLSKGLEVGVNFPLDSRSGKHAGFGYLSFISDENATRAMKELQGTVIDGHRINLEYVDHAPMTELLSQESEGPDPTSASSTQTSGVVHNDNAENTPVSAPSNNTDPEARNETVHDMLLAQTEARFPPVSQLDAHMLAGQSSEASQSNSSSGAANARNPQTAIGEGARSYVSSHEPYRGAFSPNSTYWSHVEPPANHQPPPFIHYQRPHVQRHRLRLNPDYQTPWGLHRATTMREPETHRRSFDPFEPQPGLRRRATERHALRGPRVYPRGPRHRASLEEQTPNLSAHNEEPDLQASRRELREEQKRRAIEECVSMLVDMGYGSEGDGGRQRLEIYAAAAKGELAEAIDMIEEERMAYEQRE
ncbi:RNA recognition motif domain-containing protein [Aspergillus mulundensis]|uniref:RRM domain-containing protein n=1 Tax=Aspergillus mulundensis TaxID=1810919 RepID=A0A3D8SKF5_9EURO|nr:hypothetical protein DSM5745_03435 [Aspergillus mulundensis]RDW86793.1 hypothetical protein DSM5745_03435 [Aspergillus mulundensis]